MESTGQVALKTVRKDINTSVDKAVWTLLKAHTTKINCNLADIKANINRRVANTVRTLLGNYVTRTDNIVDAQVVRHTLAKYKALEKRMATALDTTIADNYRKLSESVNATISQKFFKNAKTVSDWTVQDNAAFFAQMQGWDAALKSMKRNVTSLCQTVEAMPSGELQHQLLEKQVTALETDNAWLQANVVNQTATIALLVAFMQQNRILLHPGLPLS